MLDKLELKWGYSNAYVAAAYGKADALEFLLKHSPRGTAILEEEDAYGD